MYVLSVTTTPKAWSGTSALTEKNKRIQTALGFHPQLIHTRHSEIELFDYLLNKTNYVGEVGLDGTPAFKAHHALQEKIFQHILKKSALSGGKYLSIHSRRASSAVLKHIANYPDAGIPILHWYTGNLSDLQKAIQLECWFSVGPAMLASKKGLSLAQSIPKNRILTETDGPFGTFFGRKLLPWDVKIALQQLAKLWGCNFQEADEIVTDNFARLLKKITPM